MTTLIEIRQRTEPEIVKNEWMDVHSNADGYFQIMLIEIFAKRPSIRPIHKQFEDAVAIYKQLGICSLSS
jgi:hypothetical protein